MLLLIIQQQRTHCSYQEKRHFKQQTLFSGRVQPSFKDSRGIFKQSLIFDLCENTQTDEVWFVPLRKEEA